MEVNFNPEQLTVEEQREWQSLLMAQKSLIQRKIEFLLRYQNRVTGVVEVDLPTPRPHFKRGCRHQHKSDQS